MRFEWDDEKNRANIEKHGISFEQASSIFDGITLGRVDDRFNYAETRELSIGLMQSVAVIVVVHTDRKGVRRIISARQANRTERRRYEEEIRKAALR
ncbi:MAG: BrnT family toxin [Alphaproteobacteria bacterium]|nr:BrnT family toxin [Alphaproteobacteria bacterium]